MQQSVIYQGWKEEFLQEGEQKGAIREAQAFVLHRLIRRVGNITPTTQAQVQALSLTQLESLGEALLDFSQPTDLAEWLGSHS
jgi:predicted transposase YdaD